MLTNGSILVKQSLNLNATVNVNGSKNAALPIIASLILTSGKSILHNIPNSSDVIQMIELLIDLGAEVNFKEEQNLLVIDTSSISKFKVSPEIMNKMRASILVMGPLLNRFGKAEVALPGGCLIGARPIDYHLKGFKKLGVKIEQGENFLRAYIEKFCNNQIILEYPSVGATENLIMFSVLQQGTTVIINAALEPEVLDFIDVLKKMGANIELKLPATVVVNGVNKLKPIEHLIIPDRLEAGALLLSAAITGGEVVLPNARFDHMYTFIEKLKEMGHDINIDFNGQNGLRTGIKLKATKNPIAVDIKTCPYPGFPTDLQAPMMVALCLAQGISKVEETVFENRLMHVKELEKMGAQIKIKNSHAIVNGVEKLYGANVIASDIRASAALVLAGLVAEGKTAILGIHHWRRGYDKLENKLQQLGADIIVNDKV